MITRYRLGKSTVATLGVSGAIMFWFQQLHRRWIRTNSRLLTLRAKRAKYPLRTRPHTSDREVFWHVFVERDYSCLDHIQEATLVIDCGAYVGYSAAYFLSQFPRCELLAIEPYPDNFKVLCLNLQPYGQRVTVTQAAVWSHRVGLKISDGQYRDGREWAKQVRECRPGEEPDVNAIDIGTLLRNSGHDRISILKMDIEGAEGVVFAKNYEQWIDRVDSIVIELHDDSSFGDCSAVFLKAIEGRGFSVSRYGGLTVCKRVLAAPISAR